MSTISIGRESLVFVDLDRTLISATSTHLQLREYVKSIGILQTFLELIQVKPLNRFAIKKLLADRDSGINYEKFFRADVIEVLKKFKAEGRKIILATGSLATTGSFVIERYPIKIDHVLGSSANCRLKGDDKLRAISRYVEEMNYYSFIYIGDAMIDLKIMRMADESYFAGNRLVFLFATRVMRIRRMVKT